ncbi:universal stress protein in QAH/OAS sulfhydrylase 3'region-like [Ruditapes philippinarum]|uniref:universal stress protein in QAH/OAS sulfhydrylase 3'region-like n=1 Tax=Ruditapes philippinarum TaxID=129788 RepID=UPI00295A9C6E|nr:universal stress protein in QAH/OAS sulfhydrylase 3'region-like [Ruditapes philippinarum]
MASSEGKRVVVVAVDDSEFASKAFKFYVDDVKKDGDYVFLLHVPDSLDLSLGSPTTADKALRELKANVEAIEKKYTQEMENHGCNGRFKTAHGKPGEVICDIAKHEKAELIVVGTRGLGVVRRTFLGSVSDYIVQHAHVPVLVCRH